MYLAVILLLVQRSYKMYRLTIDSITKLPNPAVVRLLDNAGIPFDPDNTDYQQYLLWLEQGNVPLPPDEAK